MELVFWISALTVAYIYVGYPLLVAALAGLLGSLPRKAAHTPTVTVITAAYNEALHIEATVRNKMEQDYPSDLLDVIVVSDESDDGTDAIVEQLGDRVRLLRQAPRAGKTAALNRAVLHACGEILVFSDANSWYAPDAIRKLVINFSDPKVGYVTGKMLYVNPDGALVGDGCTAYMKYENLLRECESRLGTVIGVDGGIDAVRRDLYQPMRADQLPDFVLPLLVASTGRRVVYEPEALLKEDVLSDSAAEYRMRVRVSLRALWALWDLKHLLNPVRHPLLTLQLLSHKLLRYLAFVPLAAAWGASLFLIDEGGVYAIAAFGQTSFYVLAGGGWLSQGRIGGGLLGYPYYFLLLNAAAAHAVVRFLRRERQATWMPRTG